MKNGLVGFPIIYVYSPSSSIAHALHSVGDHRSGAADAVGDGCSGAADAMGDGCMEIASEIRTCSRQWVVAPWHHSQCFHWHLVSFSGG